MVSKALYKKELLFRYARSIKNDTQSSTSTGLDRSSSFPFPFSFTRAFPFALALALALTFAFAFASTLSLSTPPRPSCRFLLVLLFFLHSTWWRPLLIHRLLRPIVPLHLLRPAQFRFIRDKLRIRTPLISLCRLTLPPPSLRAALRRSFLGCLGDLTRRGGRRRRFPLAFGRAGGFVRLLLLGRTRAPGPEGLNFRGRAFGRDDATGFFGRSAARGEGRVLADEEIGGDQRPEGGLHVVGADVFALLRIEVAVCVFGLGLGVRVEPEVEGGELVGEELEKV